MRIYVDMDGVLCDYDSAWDRNYSETCQYPQSIPGFFKTLDPIEGSIEALKAIAEIHEVYILTRPSIKNPHCWTEKALWIEKHLGREWLERTIITCRKDLLFDGDSYLVDDVLYSDAGQQVFAKNNKLIWFANGWTWQKVLHILGCD